MKLWQHHAKRIAIDGAGYFLLLAAALTGWLPGPGGIPLALAGLGLLSINNAWARRLRTFLLNHGGKTVQILFPKNPFFEWLYDVLVVMVLAVVSWLAFKHAAIWQLSVAVALFFIALTIALLNRDRYQRLTRPTKHKQ